MDKKKYYTIPKDSAFEEVLKLAILDKGLVIIAYELGRSANMRKIKEKK